MTTTAPAFAFPTAASAREALHRAQEVLRPHVRRLDEATRGPVTRTIRAGAATLRTAVAGPLQRLGDLAERYVGAKIKRRVKPPILAALLVGGLALAVALFALSRK